MAIYSIQLQIQSNAPVDKLGYQLEVYKDINDVPKYALHKTPITPLEAGYKTQVHRSLEIDPTKDQHFVIAIMVYRKVGINYIPMFNKPKTKVYSLNNPPVLSANKAENITYFETVDTTKPKQSKTDVNTRVLNISAKKRPFEDQLYKEGTPKDPFSYARIEQQIQARLNSLDYPNQQGTSLCGAAAFFYCLLKDQPSIYEQVAWDLWSYGNVQIGNLQIKPSNNCRYPNDIDQMRISGLDWMTLAGLRDTQNLVVDMKVRNPNTKTGFIMEGLAGITTVSDAKGWFEKVGAKCVFDNTMLWSPSGINHAKLKNLCDLNMYSGRSNYHVITLIGMGMLKFSDGGTGQYPESSKDHWIVWESKITDLNGNDINERTPMTEKVKLKAFSWGGLESNYLRPNLSLGDLLKYVFGGFVVTKIP